MTEDKVEQFLYEIFGYGKIGELVAGQKAPNVKVRDFFKGTLLGTFRDKRYSSGERIKLPPASSIYEIEGQNRILKRNEAGREYHQPLSNPSQGLKYATINRGLFGDMTPSSITDFCRGFREQLFKEGEYSFRIYTGSIDKRPNSRFDLTLRDEDFNFFATGYKSRNNPRDVQIQFNVDSSVVEDINNLVAKYHAMRRGKKPFSRGIVLNNMSREDITNGSMGEMIENCKATIYNKNVQYSPGEVILHNSFGRGIVQESLSSKIKVFFPGIKEEKVLIQK